MRYVLCMTLVLLAVMVVWAPIASADVRSFRTIGSERYEILEARDLVIYSTDVIVRKGALEKEYFFSVGLGGEIVPLTILNLKNAFPNNHAFHDSLDMVFKNNSQLTKYDDFHKMYKVNRLLAASKE
jgi:hypothetical protein